jgi:hypothetical protein
MLQAGPVLISTIAPPAPLTGMPGSDVMRSTPANRTPIAAPARAHSSTTDGHSRPIAESLSYPRLSLMTFLIWTITPLGGTDNKDIPPEVLAHGLEIIVCELIPGPDDLLSSYYTYIAPNGQHLFHFTKRIIRRSPPNFGLGSYHATEWLPDTAEMGKRFFCGIGFRGLGNIEFKRDPRDGQLKLIEVNARFTAAQELLVRAQMDIAWIVYLHVTGGVVPTVNGFKEHLRLWYFLDDFDAYRDLRALGQLSFLSWVRSISSPQVLPYFSFHDPKPALAKGWNTLQTRVLKRRFVGATPFDIA